jgi:glycogen operon protein
VTAVELLPVHAFLNDRFLVERGLRNYWGYNTAAFFAPEPSYLTSHRLDEMRIAVRQLHAAGIEVILDVVYNHTCEGNETGPTVSWRGLDNASYYRLIPGDERHHINDTGCGNTVNLLHPRVLQMVMDSLRYWSTAFNIDGFRFDLGVTLGREASGFDPGSGFFDAIRQDPVLSQRKLISEPWDIGPGGYQLGGHPPGFAEWNDRFRDCVRRFWRGDAGLRPDLAARLTGSSDLFNRRFRKPTASINYVASHDGFTLTDLVSYERKHNEINGENNNDGHNENYSSNWGVEGPAGAPANDETGGETGANTGNETGNATVDEQAAGGQAVGEQVTAETVAAAAAIEETRARVARSMIGTLFIALGTPMLLAGDEACRTQQGNNNAYCQDNDISWIDCVRHTDDRVAQTPSLAARDALSGRRSRSAAGAVRRGLVRRARRTAVDRRMAGPRRPRIHTAARGSRTHRRNGSIVDDVERVGRHVAIHSAAAASGMARAS